MIEITITYDELDESEVKAILDAIESIHTKLELPVNMVVNSDV